MDKFTVFPNAAIKASGPVSDKFLDLGINGFIDVCRYVHELPYGYNSDRNNLMILFKEKYGYFYPAIGDRRQAPSERVTAH
jgi:hypothetical protein